MPAALPGEFAFAASGQSLVTEHGRRAWFGTGGAAQARVFRSDDGGTTWQVSGTPIHCGPSAGIFALAFRGQQHGFAVGGESWDRFDDGSFDTVDCAGKNACWASGEQGRTAHLVTSH
jgi:photosystem II stability/assembly factor-like uncharacterized protein